MSTGKSSLIQLKGELCSDIESSSCIENSVCYLLDGFPSCQCKIGFSGSADAETEGACIPDKNEVSVQMSGIKTDIDWKDHLLLENSEESFRAKKGIIEVQALNMSDFFIEELCVTIFLEIKTIN